MFTTVSRLKVLIVDGEASIRESLSEYLAGEAVVPLTAATCREARALIVRERPDVVLLDLALPDGNGLDLIGSGGWSHRPAFIVISERVAEIDRVLCLELGADDYIAKPFSFRELLARIRAVCRRMQRHRAPAVARDEHPPRGECGGLEIDPGNHKALVAGHGELPLTGAEISVLLLLYAHRGNILSREALTREVFGRDWVPQDRSIDQIVASLRRKICAAIPNWNQLKTLRGRGYMLVG